MQEPGTRRLHVVDESGRLLGVFSLADVVRGAESEALSARIIAARFGLVACGIGEPCQVGKPARVASPAHAPGSSGERQAAVG